MYLILTSKPGQYHTQHGEGLTDVATFDYLSCGRKRARFVIAEPTGTLSSARVSIVEEDDTAVVNVVPAKFLPSYETLPAAREALGELTRFGSIDSSLVEV